MTATIHAVMTRGDVRGLLLRHTDTQVTDALVTAWLTGLADYCVAEVHAVMTAMGPAARRATPSEIAGRCDASRDRTASAGHRGHRADDGRTRRNGSGREYYRQAGLRGIRLAYSAMGWQRNADHDLARTVACPFCRARAGVVCTPLSRNRAGVREARDKTTRMHPSRLQLAMAERQHSNSSQENRR